MKAIGKKSLNFIDGIINYSVLAIVLALAAFAGYALWDSNRIYDAADKSNYAVYKPTIADEGKSFKELQSINAEVFAWLTVYGTNIDYPVTQGPDNMKYVNTNAEGRYSLSGAIFLDTNAAKDFSGFNNIFYGHHMEKKKMFGEIGTFLDKDVFDSLRYGNLYYEQQDHGIEFFAFLHTDAYDTSVFRASVKGEDRQKYLDNLLEKAMYKRDIEINEEDHIVLLSTCSSGSTNGRDILIGKITDETYESLVTDTLETKKAGTGNLCCSAVEEIPMAVLLAMLLIVLLLALMVIQTFNAYLRQKQNKKQKTEGGGNI